MNIILKPTDEILLKILRKQFRKDLENRDIFPDDMIDWMLSDKEAMENNFHKWLIKEGYADDVQKYVDKNNHNDEVQKFCKENNIEYSWDWNKGNGIWNEILFEGKLLMQLTQGITIEQFKNVITILSQNFYATEFQDNGIDFTVCIEQNVKTKKVFDKFLEKYADVFLTKKL
jgi:hypothetical protein